MVSRTEGKTTLDAQLIDILHTHSIDDVLMGMVRVIAAAALDDGAGSDLHRDLAELRSVVGRLSVNSSVPVGSRVVLG